MARYVDIPLILMKLYGVVTSFTSPNYKHDKSKSKTKTKKGNITCYHTLWQNQDLNLGSWDPGPHPGVPMCPE